MSPPLAACSPARPRKSSAHDGWARATGQSDIAAAYVTIDNKGGADKLTGVRSTIGDAMLHESSMDGGVMRMRPDRPATKAWSCRRTASCASAAGGAHVMIMGLKKPLKAGDRFDMTLLFAQGRAAQGDASPSNRPRSEATFGSSSGSWSPLVDRLRRASIFDQRPATPRPVDADARSASAGPFTLVDSKGQPFASSKLAGRPYAIFFGFTHCPDVCPTTLARLVKLRRQLGRATTRFQIVFVTVDPERDGPAEVGSYAELFDTPDHRPDRQPGPDRRR